MTGGTGRGTMGGMGMMGRDGMGAGMMSGQKGMMGQGRVGMTDHQPGGMIMTGKPSNEDDETLDEE